MTIGGRIARKLVLGYRALTLKKVPVKVVPPKPPPPVEGVEIPTFRRRVKIKPPTPPKAKKTLVYPIVPRRPKKGEPIFAYARISWNPKLNRYLYELVEPPLPEKLRNVLKRVKQLLEERLDVEFTRLKRFEAVEYLHKQIDELLSYFRIKLTETEKRILHYYVERDFIGLERIEAFMKDPNIEDISCDGVGLPIYIFHRDPEIASVVSNVRFDTAEELDSFVTRLAQLCGKSISVAEPIVGGTLPDGSRLQATLATDIARKGSNFTIRKFRREPLTPIDLLEYGTVDVRTLAYLWYMVDHGRSLLISGGTAVGKTAFLNVLSLFIRPEKKIVSIEDTSEINLPHPHWVPSVARTPIAAEPGKEVDLYALLRESLRVRPDYIIVGEVRGPEAYILFQQIATGHPSMATIHAESMPRLFDRLTTPPISLPPSLIASLDLIIFLASMTYKERFVRKVTEVLEMRGFDPEAKRPIVDTIFKWNPLTDRWDVVSKSKTLLNVSKLTGTPVQEITDELQRRMKVLSWMWERGITYYKDVYKVICDYYTNPRRVLAAASIR